MNSELMEKIQDKNFERRDLLVDQLNDEIELGSYKETDLQYIISILIGIFSTEKDDCLHESIMNFISNSYLMLPDKEEVNELIISNYEDMKPNVLCHAISIIFDSDIPQKKDVLRSLLVYPDEEISKIVANYLSKSPKL